jgi:hypothetical protein
MVLAFTGSLSVAQAGSEDVRTMLIGALGCNLAWGIIDGVLYLMGCLSEQGLGIRTLQAVKNAKAPEEAHRVIADSLPPIVAATLGPAEYERLRRKLIELPEPPTRRRLHRQEWLGAFSVFLWVLFTTFPVAIPFIFIHKIGLAMRLSNAVAITMLFLTGIAFGRVAAYRPWLTGFAMVLLGGALVAVTIALGG